MKFTFIASLLLFSVLGATTASAMPSDEQPITVRTENFPRLPYSGATYYIYEQDGSIICTKLEVCNKYDQCSVTYFDGLLKQAYDIRTGAPYDTTAPVEIQPKALKKHFCLTKFGLN